MHLLRQSRGRLGSLLLLCVACPIAGQAPTGSITGEIHDPTGASVGGAQLVLRDVATEALRSTTASLLGSYEFPQLTPGVYDLSIEAKGFRRTVERHIVVNVGSAVHLDVTMPLGDVSETVEVNAEPPLIEPDKVSIGSIVDLHSIQYLPLEDRQFLNLDLIAPGTIPGAPGTRVAGSSVETFSVVGMRSQSNNYTLDGISNNDPHINGPLNLFRIADAVQEFNVETSIPGAEAGRNSGAQVSIITKSGGNAYHGTLFYYVRNDALDATPFFLSRAGLPKNPLHRNQFGGTVGGFIRRDKAFWFASFESYDQSVQDPATGRVPTDTERAEVTDPVFQTLLSFWPRANTPQLLLATGMNWAGTTPDEAKDETYLWRIDQNLTHNHRLTGRFVWLTGSTLVRQTSPFDGTINNSPGQLSLLVQDTYSTDRLVNEGRFGYSRNKAFLQPADANINPALIFVDSTGKTLPGYIDTRVDPLNGGLPTITITGFTGGGLGVGGGYPQGRTTNSYEFLDDLSLIGPCGDSRHTLNLGAGARSEIANLFLNAFFRGSISFPNWNAYGSGQPSRGSLATGPSETFRRWSRIPVYLYAQDEFRSRANLTFNFGLRWEYPGALTELGNRGSNFVPGVGQMILNSNSRIDVDPTQLGRAALLQTPVNTWLPRNGQFSVPNKNFAPFIGVAYSPAIWPRMFGHSSTVIRAGFRISYDDIFDDVPALMGLNFPPALSTTLPRGSYTWATVLNQNLRLFASDPTVLPQGQRGILTFSAIDTHPSSPYSMNYAFEMQRQLGKSLSLEVSYTGSQGRRLAVTLDPNQPVVMVNDPTKRGDQAPNQRTFPYPQYSNILQAAFVSNSNFNGLALVAHERMTRGLNFTASYELSKSLDDNSGFFPSDGDSAIYADSKNRTLNYGRSSFDVRQHVIASFVYKLPTRLTGAIGRRVVPRQILEGWAVSGVTTFRSGFPFTVLASSDTDFTGLNRWTPAGGFSDRVDIKPGITVVPQNMSNPDYAFDPEVFSFPQAGRPGNVGRNSLIGPQMIDQDFAILRDLPIRKTRQAQFRVEAFNLFNHTNFELPENRLDQSSVGKIGASYDPRLIQLSLRFQW
ncbi:putative Cna B domain protein [Candidatus Sulfotelmatomonas gaucii]|uniref:Putative Cna B domain protein n=1 Tax=Candidatus Sulfuritelmatomonas gaucii TaxID=2043161 RepID=A0A2N9M6R7_9BACT|nr:putative Cna B domain protein [Candidatus Sulfotelmatomonas gaucii]